MGWIQKIKVNQTLYDEMDAKLERNSHSTILGRTMEQVYKIYLSYKLREH